MNQQQLRPATEADPAAILALLRAVDVADLGETDWTADGLADSWAAPGVDPARDAVVVVEEGQVLAYGIAERRGETGISLDHYVAAGYERTAGVSALAAVCGMADRQLRALELPLHGIGAGSVRLGQAVDGPFTPVLAELGWRPVRTFHRMARSLTSDDRIDPPLPNGVKLRGLADRPGIEASEDDLRSFHAVRTASFSEHFGASARPWTEWLAGLRTQRRNDFSLWWLAEVDGRDAGILLAEVPGSPGSDDPSPVIDLLGTLAEARGRGVGTTLLRAAFAELARRGHRRVELGVDTANVTPAVALYEHLGMHPVWAIQSWERGEPAVTATDPATA